MTHTPTLKPCPFCGHGFKIGQEPPDNDPVAGMFYLYHEYGPLVSAARKCPISVVHHFETRAEATAAWNGRAIEGAAFGDAREALEFITNVARMIPGFSPMAIKQADAALAKIGGVS